MDGLNGTDGVDGVDGLNGTNGIDGIDGTDGINGTDGFSCWDLNQNFVCDLATEDIDLDLSCTTLDCAGPQGLQGAPGVDGLNGTDGQDGADGINGTDGAQGPQGPPGVDGLNGTNGIDGINGTDGINGVDGVDGLNGTDGFSCWDLNQNFACDLGTEDINSDLACDVLDCAGPAGQDGINGTDGAQGPPGVDGINGTDGAQGPPGVDGLNGTDGIDGVDGLNGTNGIDGINGTNGIDGINGTDGTDGADGINGTDGAQGPAGPTLGIFDSLGLLSSGNLSAGDAGGLDLFNLGNTGIGVGIPNHSLHVFGDARITGGLLIGAGTVVINDTGIIFPDGSFQSVAAVTDDGDWNTSGNATFKTDGFVAVGKQFPEAPVDVLGASIGIKGRASESQSSAQQYGVLGLGNSANPTETLGAVGVYGESFVAGGHGVFGKSGNAGSGNQYGVRGKVSGSFTGNAYAIYGEASGGTNNWGGYFLGDGHFSGNVGIGTDVPSAKLDVDGSARIRTITQDDALNEVIVKDANGVLKFRDAATIANNDGDWNVSGNDLIQGNQEGNVGIGTDTPGAKLDIETNVGESGATIGRDDNTATGSHAIAMGVGNTAPGFAAIAMGGLSVASGQAAVAMGTAANASGTSSIAMGQETHAGSRGATATGIRTRAEGDTSTAMGGSITVDGDNSFGIGLDTTQRTITQANTMAVVGGNVGLGTVDPTEQLDIDGQARIRTINQDDSLDEIIVKAANGTLLFRDASTITNNDGDWNVSGSDLIMGDQELNVGIGTDTVDAGISLQVFRAGSHGIKVESGTNGGTATQIDLRNSISGLGGTLSHFNGDLLIDAGAQGNRVMALKGNSGNVGIGTNDPTELLDVNGQARVRNITQDDALDEILVKDTNGVLKFRDAATITNDDGDWNTSGNDLVQGNQEGSVGIGTDTPQAKLDVETATGEGGAARLGSSTNIATGDFAVAMGASALATGLSSVAMGGAATASGTSATAIGSATTASGLSSLATGVTTTAEGIYTTAMGRQITVSGNNSFGIGLDDKSRTISENNIMAIVGGLVGLGTVSPTEQLDVNGSARIRTINQDDSLNEIVVKDTNGVLKFRDATTLNDNDWNVSGNDLVQGNQEGNVGIGVTNPTQKLDVNGNINTSGAVFASAFSSNSPLLLQTGGVTRIVADDVTGNVGIGTTTPDTQLDVDAGNASPTLTIQSSDSSSSSVIHAVSGIYHANFGIENGVAKIQGLGPTPIVLNSGASQTMSFQSNGVTKMSINPISDNIVITAGRVGIGIGSPTATLDVDGNATVSGNVGIGTTTPAAKLHVNGNIQLAASSQLVSNNFGVVTSAQTMNFNSAGTDMVFSTVQGEAMRIANDGDIGIGTGSPASGRSLHIVRAGSHGIRVESGTNAGTATSLDLRNSVSGDGATFSHFNGDLLIDVGNPGNRAMTIEPTGDTKIEGDMKANEYRWNGISTARLLVATGSCPVGTVQVAQDSSTVLCFDGG